MSPDFTKLENESKLAMVAMHLAPTTFFACLYFTVAFGMYLNRFRPKLCQSIDGRPGKCVRLTDCPSAAPMLKERRYPNLCEFDFYEPMICCEDYQTKRVDYGNIAKQKCLEYSARSGTALNAFILHGVDSSSDEFPHMVLLGFGPEEKIDWRCGGTLISETFILTAGHCLQYKTEPVSYAQLGTTYREDLKHGGVRIKIKRTHRHPDYIPTQKYNDIGLVELERKVEFNDLIKPACLQVEEKIDSAELIATGWGANHVGGDLSPTLRKLNLTIVPYDICYQSYQPEVRLEQGLNNEQQFCANAMNGGDTCQGDSGGPLQYKPEGSKLYVVAGITSFGVKCGLIPSVYTRVSHYVTWIESIVWPL